MGRLSRLVFCAVLAASFALIVAAPAPAAAAEPSPTAPRTVTFVAGVHTGYKFDASGNVTGSKTASWTRPSNASATARKAIAGRGVHLYISAGVYAGYWVAESSLVYAVGLVGDRSFATTAVWFPAGTYLGYRFTSTWSLAAAKPARLPATSMAHANRSAVINGRPYVAIVDGIWAGYWMPGSTASPSRIACRAGNRVPAGGAQVIRSVATTLPKMSLTFDMGGRLDPALAILNTLIVDRTCATIFATGDAANTTTGTAVMSVVRAHPELFEAGNHTMHHCDFVYGGGASTYYCPKTRPAAAFEQSELTSAASIIRAKSGQSPAPYWRPPYGSYDTAVVSAAAAVGYTKTFLWSIDTIDWKPVTQGGPNALDVATKVRAGATKGSVVLMHLGGYPTLDALPYTLAGIRGKSLTPTTLSDLMQ